MNFSRSVRLRQRLYTQPIDLTDWQFWSQIRTAPNSTLIQDITCETDVDVLTLSLTSEETSALPLGSNNSPFAAHVDVIAQKPNGQRICLLEAKVTIQGLITEVPA